MSTTHQRLSSWRQYKAQYAYVLVCVLSTSGFLKGLKSSAGFPNTTSLSVRFEARLISEFKEQTITRATSPIVGFEVDFDKWFLESNEKLSWIPEGPADQATGPAIGIVIWWVRGTNQRSYQVVRFYYWSGWKSIDCMIWSYWITVNIWH